LLSLADHLAASLYPNHMEVVMVKDKPRRNEKKKPLMSLKERRAKKHEKRHYQQEHRIGEQLPE